MKNILFLLAFTLFLLTSCTENKPVQETKKTDTIVASLSIPKIHYVLVGKNIDFNLMEIDSVMKTILEKDSFMIVKPISTELQLKSEVIKVYKVEDITCPYLKTRFKDNQPSDIVFEYSGKLLVKCKDGVIKVYHFHYDEKIVK